jgi:hypothetical protein
MVDPEELLQRHRPMSTRKLVLTLELLICKAFHDVDVLNGAEG